MMLVHGTVAPLNSVRLGEREKAGQWLNRALSLDPEDGAVLYGIACVYALLGEDERALDALERGIRAGFGRREWAEKDPDFASLRESPRFRKLLETMPTHFGPVHPSGGFPE